MSNETEQSLEMRDIKNKEDLEHAVQMPRLLLTPLGLWPVNPSSSYTAILRPFSIIFSTFMLLFMFFPNLLYIFIIEKDIGARLILVGPLSFTIMSISKYIGILSKNQDLQVCITEIAVDWHEIENPKDRNIMLRNTKIARVFTTICTVFMYSGGLLFTIIMPLAKGVIVIGNETIRHFAYPGYYVFFNPHTRPNYDILYSIHCMCGVVTYTINIGLCSITILCILHICGQVDIITSMLQNLSNKFDRKVLGRIVRKHLRFLRFASKLEGILTQMCFVEIAGCTFNMCMLGYYVITGIEKRDNFTSCVYTVLFISFTLNIFIFCYIGDLLTERCSSLKEATYAVKWYNLTANDARNLILIVASTYNPVVLTAGKLIKLSLQTFTSVLKVSLTYLNMLRTFTVSLK